MSLDQNAIAILHSVLHEHADGTNLLHSLSSQYDKTLVITLVCGELPDGPAEPLSEEAERAVSDAHAAIMGDVIPGPRGIHPMAWIRTSERLPEKDGRYLIAYNALLDDRLVLAVDYVAKTTNGPRWRDDMNGQTYTNERVLAWMPLPKYKPEGE